MTEGKSSEEELTGDANSGPAAAGKWYERPAGRAAASMVSIGFLGIVVAAMLLLTQRAHQAETATETTDSAPATATATETPSEPPPSSAPSSAPTSKPTTTSAERPTTVPPRTSPPPRPPATTPRFVPAPAAPTTVPTTPVEATAGPTTAEGEPPEMPELNVTRDPIEMSPYRGEE